MKIINSTLILKKDDLNILRETGRPCYPVVFKFIVLPLFLDLTDTR